MKKFSWFVYRAMCGLAALKCPRPEFTGVENLPTGRPCIIVGNHAQIYGPAYAELYLPCERATWCIAEVMHLREVPDYAYQDFWSKKPRWCRWFYRLLSYAVAPLCVSMFNNANCIGVYRDRRVMSTLRESVERMEAGKNIVIFPEHEVPHNPIVWEFQEGFVNLAAMYARRTGQPVDFVPMYVAPRLRRASFGKPIPFDPAAPLAEERHRVCRALMDAITDMALAMPPHRVVPYPNLPRRQHPLNQLHDKETTA